VFAGDLPPQAFRRGAPYASLSVLGAVLYLALARATHLDHLLVEAVVILVVAGLRVLGLWRGWSSPQARDLTPRFLRKPDRPPDG
jgi:uncharacterized membrane protein YeiH